MGGAFNRGRCHRSKAGIVRAAIWKRTKAIAASRSLYAVIGAVAVSVAVTHTGALTTTNNTAVTKKVDTASTNSDQPSIVTVEVLDFGGGDGTSDTERTSAPEAAPNPPGDSSLHCGPSPASDPTNANCP